MRPAHLPSLFGVLGILYTYFAADHRWQMANIDVHCIYTAHTLYIICRYVGMHLNIIMLVYVPERVLWEGEGVPRETKRQTVILGGCFNVSWCGRTTYVYCADFYTIITYVYKVLKNIGWKGFTRLGSHRISTPLQDQPSTRRRFQFTTFEIIHVAL